MSLNKNKLHFKSVRKKIHGTNTQEYFKKHFINIYSRTLKGSFDLVSETRKLNSNKNSPIF